MEKLGDYLASQCGNPRGVIGKIMTWAMNRANNVMYKGIIEEINISPKTKILDVGFGNGYLEKLIIRKSPCSITGIDISEDMVRKANTIYFWSDTAKGIAEISRVLKEGGIFYNAVISKENLDKFFYTKNGFRKFTKEEYIALGKKAGFRRIRIKKLGNDYGLLIIYMK